MAIPWFCSSVKPSSAALRMRRHVLCILLWGLQKAERTNQRWPVSQWHRMTERTGPTHWYLKQLMRSTIIILVRSVTRYAGTMHSSEASAKPWKHCWDAAQMGAVFQIWMLKHDIVYLASCGNTRFSGLFWNSGLWKLTFLCVPQVENMQEKWAEDWDWVYCS